MLGIAVGAAFLTGFGLGWVAVIIWIGLGLLVVAREQLSLIAVLTILACATVGAIQADRTQSFPTDLIQTGDFEGTVRVVDGPYLTRSGQRFLVRSDYFPSVVFCAYAGPAPRMLTGDLVFVSGRVSELRDLSDISRATAVSRGCGAQLGVDSMTMVERGRGLWSGLARMRVGLSTFLMGSAPGDSGALLSGLVTGDDGAMSQEANRAFVDSGTTHITAISGANFAMLTLLLGVLATGSMRRNIVFVIGASAVIWLYALMVGLQPSALRAALLATAVLAGRCLGRRPDLLTLTVLLAAIHIAFRPHDFQTLAFQLSVAATLALIVVFDGSERMPGRSWGVSLGLSVVAAQLATIPILAWQIGTLSVIGLFANLIVGPLAGVAFPIALIGALAGRAVGPIGEIILLPAEWICRLTIGFVEWFVRRAPGSVQLGEPTLLAIGTIAAICWAGVFAMSGDLRRIGRHSLGIIKSW